MNLNNLILYCAQVCVVVAVSGLVSRIVRLKDPGARLVWWQCVLAACLALPAMRPWNAPQVFVTESAGVDLPLPPMHAVVRPAFHLDWERAAAYLLAAGVVWRLLMLLAGFVRLSVYRRRSAPLSPASSWGVEAELMVSPHVSGPVTFGVRRPVVLLPPRFREFDGTTQDAILCHEILHVRRKDWLFTVGEEIVRAALWFHPAVWWVLAEIQLAREEAVDRAAIDLLGGSARTNSAHANSRDAYVDALLTIAAGGRESELAPAPLFLRRRHLKQRVVSIFEEGGMSRTAKTAAFAASMVMLAASCWYTTGALQLQAAPQTVVDSAGVSVQTAGAEVLHRGAVAYPREAVQKGVEGEVVAQVKTDGSGNVSDATILSGPEELRKPVLQSVLNWHFGKDAANATRQVTVRFSLAPAKASSDRFERSKSEFEAKTLAELKAKAEARAEADKSGAAAGKAGERTIAFIRVEGVSDKTRDEILSKLPVGVGAPLTVESSQQIMAVLKGIDEHLILRPTPGPAGKLGIVISLPPSRGVNMVAPEIMAPNPPQPTEGTASKVEASPGPTPESIRVGGDVAQRNIIAETHLTPIYPPMAKAARVQGTVRFEVIIAKDGTIRNLRLVSGQPLLVQSAIEAVRQWTYRPTLLNGNPVEVITTVDVNYSLSDGVTQGGN